MHPSNFFRFLRFGLQTKVVFITVLTGALVGGLLASFQIYQNKAKNVEIARDRLRRDGSIIEQEIMERGDKALDISKKIAITLRIFESMDRKTIQQIISSFQKKNPEYQISVRSPENIFLKNSNEENFQIPENHPSIFSALNGDASVSIEKTSTNGFSIAASAPMILKTKIIRIVHTEWPFTPEFTGQLRKLIDKDIIINFFPLTGEKQLSNLIRDRSEKNSWESLLNYNQSSLQNPFFSKSEGSTPSLLTYYVPLMNSHGVTLGAIQIQLSKPVIFSNKGFFQYGVFILLFPLLMGLLTFLLIRYMITTRIIQLARVARTISVGNFIISLPQKRSKDEIGELTSALSEMKQKIENKTNELTSLNDALFAQKKHLLKLNYELNQKNDYIASLVSTVSHELRTPMASIMGFTELLLNRKLPHEKQRSYIETIYLESKRLASILNDFLDIQKMESNEPGFIFEEISLKEIIETVLARFSPSIYPKHQFIKSLPADIPLVKGDKSRIIQCLMNLVSNAIKYSPKGGKIKIEIAKEEKEILTSVRDNGLGIPKEMQGRLFTKFFRVDSSDHRGIGGTGLGLALCKEIIELHGGKIWAESEEGKGSRFTFSLPLP